MIELERNELVFAFPQVHESAKLRIEFQRTLRIPDDDKEYPLPPGLGAFPLRHVDDHARNVPAEWLEHGGVMLPMYQSEAMWLSFAPQDVDDRATEYPFAIKVAAGKINAVTGDEWTNGLHARPQDYLVAPEQPWLDGYCVKKGLIRQFVAMPLGSGYSAEEQITGKAEHGGLQIIVYPMKREVFERRFPKQDPQRFRESLMDEVALCAPCAPAGIGMGLAAGGKMRQQIYDDPFSFDDWDTTSPARCFVHIANSLIWRSITGKEPPTTPPTAKQYTSAGLPWFDYYSDGKALDAQPVLEKIKSIVQIAKQKGDVPPPENESVDPQRIIALREGLAKNQVREGAF